MANMQGLLARHQILVVTGMPTEPFEFNEAGLRTLAPLRRQVDVSDLSIIDEDGEGTGRIKRGIVAQLLEAARHKDGKVLNALEFPMQTATIRPFPIFSSDLPAWEQTTGERGFKSYEEIPTSHLRWGLAGTKGALTRLHIDTNETATYVDVKTGAKIWIFERDTVENWKDPRASFPTRLDPDLSPEHPVEAIVLQPGTRL